VSTPGVHLRADDKTETSHLARHCNEFAADMKHRRPSQFGFWAVLPLPDVQSSLDEIDFALSNLFPDGFAVKTNYFGTYLGDKSLDPVFDELNNRKSIVFIHPTTPCLPSGQCAAPLTTSYPAPMFEFFFDTARAVINLFLSGTISRCPNITWVVPHLGGALPPLINRFATIGGRLPNLLEPQISPAWVRERLNTQFFFDSAGFPLPQQLQGLLQHVTVDRILYGSDFPFTPVNMVQMLAEEYDRYLPEIFTKRREQEALCKDNALALLSKM